MDLGFLCHAGGQVLSAIVGCCVRLALREVLWLAAPMGMSLALVAMMLTRTTHPPGTCSTNLRHMIMFIIRCTQDCDLPFRFTHAQDIICARFV